eukprot:238777_1
MDNKKRSITPSPAPSNNNKTNKKEKENNIKNNNDINYVRSKTPPPFKVNVKPKTLTQSTTTHASTLSDAQPISSISNFHWKITPKKKQQKDVLATATPLKKK